MSETGQRHILVVDDDERVRTLLSWQLEAESVWDSEAAWQSEATVTEHIHRLRNKLETDPAQPRWLHTIRGVGYRLEP